MLNKFKKAIKNLAASFTSNKSTLTQEDWASITAALLDNEDINKYYDELYN